MRKYSFYQAMSFILAKLRDQLDERDFYFLQGMLYSDFPDDLEKYPACRFLNFLCSYLGVDED